MPPTKKATLVITNIGQLISMVGPAPRIGNAMNEIGLIEDGGIAVSGEEILATGKSDDVVGQTQLAEGCTVINAGGAVVTPGLVDPHTHPVFSMTREKEFEMRLQGKTYMEIAASGGGIRASVRDLRETDTETLMAKTRGRLDRMLSVGTTTIEAKSGYGLSTESELKSLRIIRDLNALHPIDMVPTFLGAHEIPDEFRDDRQAYIKLVIDEMIPAVVKEDLAEYCDIFAEEGVFDAEESHLILSAAKKAGLKLKLHADELKDNGGGALAASLGAVSADHLVYISGEGIKAMATAGTIAGLLPGTTFSLGGSQYAPARQMIESGVAVALATDCNPGSSYSESLPMIASLAAIHLRLTAAESLTAMTVNAAHAIGRSGRIGQLAAGFKADMVLWDMADYRELPYHYGVNLAKTVVKNGKVVVGQ